MLKKILLSLTTGLLIGSVAQAQGNKCGTDLLHAEMKKMYPSIAQNEQDLQKFIKNYLSTSDLLKADPNNLNDTLYIPVVVHVVHNGAADFISDDKVYQMIADLNTVYLKRNADTINVIAPFKNNIGKANIIFKLATKDPFGNPSKGITRHYSYLSNGGNDQAKLGQWAPSRYMNIWTVANIPGAAAGITLAYATYPTSAMSYPYNDGLFSRYDAMNGSKTIEHEVGHYLSLPHTWDGGNLTGTLTCGDDGIDDTPPTKVHFSTCASADLYDTACTNFSSFIGKRAIDTPSSRTTITNAPNKTLEFTTRTKVVIERATIYPAPTTPIGTPLQVQLKRNGVVINTFNDTVKATTPATRNAQLLNLNFMIDNRDTNVKYELVLSQNPGVRVDTVDALFAREIKGAIKLKKYTDDTLYNCLYALDVRYFYFKFDATNPDIVIDYPDTVNTQNIMDYSSCPIMFTNGQVRAMRAALNSNIGFRSTLWDSTNLVITGIHEPRPDLAPIADFGNTNDRRYVCVGNSITTNVELRDFSWNDTVTSREWTFSSGVTANSTVNSVINVSSTQAGWATISLNAKSNAGNSSISKQPVYFADNNATAAGGYFQEFEDANKNNVWPIFNPAENNFKWQIVNTGAYDNSSIQFRAFDDRQFPENINSWAAGDLDEFYSPVMDLTTVAGTDRYLNFMYSGAYRVTSAAQMNDEFIIQYSTNCGSSWSLLESIKGPAISTIGTQTSFYTPSSFNQWKPKSIKLPIAVANAPKVMFRFVYKSNPIGLGHNVAVVNTSNNFYVDRITFSPFSLDIADAMLENKHIAIAPNPTTSGAQVYLNLGNGQQNVKINVMDVTGKLVYSNTHNLSGAKAQIEIPAHALQTKGVYIVQVTTNGQSFAEKLVVQ